MGATNTTPIVPLYSPDGLEPGREAAAHVIAAIAANFWLDGGVALSDAAAEFFADKTDPLRPDPDKNFLDLIDLLQERPISVPLYARLVREEGKPTRLAFSWEDEERAPPHGITFRTSMERQCFTLSIPFQWERLIDAPVDLPTGNPDVPPANERGEVRLDVVAVPQDVFATPVANDARQAFGVRCESHTVISAKPVEATLLTVGGVFLMTLEPDPL